MPTDQQKRIPHFNYRKWLLFLIDATIFAVSYFALFLFGYITDRTEFSPDYLINALLFFAVLLVTRVVLRNYNHVWRYSHAKYYLMMVVSDYIGGCLAFVLSYIVTVWSGRSIYIGLWKSVAVTSVFCLFTLLSRFVYQCLHQIQNAGPGQKKKDNQKIGVAIVGAGQVGSFLAEELIYNAKSHYKPLCFVDIDRAKIGSRVCGLPVFAETPDVIEKIRSMPVQEIFIALPTIDSDSAKHLYDFYSQTDCKVKLYDFPFRDNMEPETDKRVMREIRIEDLLFRNSLHINNEETRGFYRDKTVLVTGGGGSIGSELCRQIAKCHPKKLVIFDIYENNAYEIQQELVRRYGDTLDLSVEIGSVRDVARLDCVFAAYRPDIVFHAAAHKHVPLMEHSGCEAVKNNVLGTKNSADMAEKYGVSKFILISTDKAVNPTNIMGASKRMCEMVVQCRTDSKTSFAAVRFGNVLGSNGSVIPLFRKQIENGGPVTITDKRIIRYFMTIPEASQLVMQAGAMAKSGELFVLDMGKPVKILDLAENMIRLSGFEPYVDIDIEEIGLRPGEKLYEELLIKTETLDKTDNAMIFVERDTPLSRAEVDERVSLLCRAVEDAKHDLGSEKVKAAMKQVVPTYHDPEEVNRTASDAEEMKACGCAQESPKN